MFGFHIFNEDWLTDAICGTVHPETFHPKPMDSANPAKRVCLPCPVRLDCLAWSLETHEFGGVWGGLREEERRTIAVETRDGFYTDLATLPVVFDALPERLTAEADEPTPVRNTASRSRRKARAAAPATASPKRRRTTKPKTVPAPVVTLDPISELAALLAATENHPDPTVRSLRRVLTQAATTLATAHDTATAHDASNVA